jgi:hypothetical protein
LRRRNVEIFDRNRVRILSPYRHQCPSSLQAFG